MYSKKLLTLAALSFAAPLLKASSVEVPDWHLQADRLMAAVSNVENTFATDITLYGDWKVRSNNLSASFDMRDSERLQLINCLKASYQERINQLNACKAVLADKDASIIDLNNHIASLELMITALNEEIAKLQSDLAAAQAAYDELAAQDAEKAAQLISVIQGLYDKYNEMISERNGCRGALQSLYNRVKAYNGDASSDYLDLAHSICGEGFAFSE